MNLYLLALFTIWIITAAVFDLTQHRLPNWLVVTSAILYPVSYIVAGENWLFPDNWVITAAAFAFALLMLALRMWGAGDTKFIMITFLWFPSPSLAIFVLVALLVTQLGIIAIRRLGNKIENKASIPLIPFLSVGWISWAIWMIAKNI